MDGTEEIISTKDHSNGGLECEMEILVSKDTNEGNLEEKTNCSMADENTDDGHLEEKIDTMSDKNSDGGDLELKTKSTADENSHVDVNLESSGKMTSLEENDKVDGDFQNKATPDTEDVSVVNENKESSSPEENFSVIPENDEDIQPQSENGSSPKSKGENESTEENSMVENMEHPQVEEISNKLEDPDENTSLENGTDSTKAVKRPLDESDQSSSEESDDEKSGDDSEESDQDSDHDSNLKAKESHSKTYPVSKRRKLEHDPVEINFNKCYSEPDFVKSLSNAFLWKAKLDYENGAKVFSDPFPCCMLPNFIESEEFINKVKAEIEEIDVEAKANDLYKFKQSVDLADYPSSEIQSIHNLLREKCVKWLTEITNIPLTDQVDMFCSCYTYTDHLLCHDDELEGRRIAYIYYLTPPNWEEKDGGLLDLFSSVNGEPSQIVHSFVPTCNNFVFFEVGPTSYHQVSEVLAYKTRTALSGWFYGPPLERTVHPPELVLFQSPTNTTVDINDWINPTYLQPDTQLHIRASFEESSEMELMDFFQNAKYEMVCQALNENNISWKKMGPPNRRKYEELEDFGVPEILKECQNLFKSEPFFLVLSNLTGLRFHPLSSETPVKMGEVNSSIRKWSHGSYSLLHEQSFFKFATLNAALCFNCPDWEADCGGHTSYVAKNKKDELLRVDPKPNSLALVYITKKTSCFVKYVNNHVTERSLPYFQDIFSIFREIE